MSASICKVSCLFDFTVFLKKKKEKKKDKYISFIKSVLCISKYKVIICSTGSFSPLVLVQLSAVLAPPVQRQTVVNIKTLFKRDLKGILALPVRSDSRICPVKS